MRIRLPEKKKLLHYWYKANFKKLHGCADALIFCLNACMHSTSFAAYWVGDEERGATPHYTNETFGWEATAPLHSLHVPPPQQKEACMLAH